MKGSAGSVILNKYVVNTDYFPKEVDIYLGMLLNRVVSSEWMYFCSSLLRVTSPFPSRPHRPFAGERPLMAAWLCNIYI